MIIALEGPSYAGKTTALRHLRQVPVMAGAVFFNCYVKSIARREDIPRPSTASAVEQLAAFETFMAIEETRIQQRAEQPGVVVLDRSVDTLLAHAYALDEMFGFGVHDEARERLERLPYLRPDHTLYLDVSPEVLALRRKEAGHTDLEPDYFLHDPAFLVHARHYFCGPARTPLATEVTVVPGDGGRQETAGVVQALITFWASR